jgi:hypothetical protein
LKESIIPWVIPLCAYDTRKRLPEPAWLRMNTNRYSLKFAIFAVRYTLHMYCCNVPRNHLWYEAPWVLHHTHCQFRKFETCSNAGWFTGIAKSVQRQATGSMVRVRLLEEARDFSLLHSVQINSGDHLTHQSISQKEKRPVREGDHSTPSSAEAMDGGVINPLHHTGSWRYAH